jgi:hypothetical protein
MSEWQPEQEWLDAARQAAGATTARVDWCGSRCGLLLEWGEGVGRQRALKVIAHGMPRAHLIAMARYMADWRARGFPHPDPPSHPRARPSRRASHGPGRRCPISTG